MEFHSAFTFEEDDLPTFVQYLKIHKEAIEGQVSVVTKIWFPNKYPNYQLITEKYKLSIRVTPQNSEQLADLFDYYQSNSLTMGVQITNVSAKAYKILELPSELVRWEPLGTYGWRCEIQEKSTRRETKRTTKK